MKRKKGASYNADEKLHQGAHKKIMQKRYEDMARLENASYRTNGEALFLEFPGKWENMLTSKKTEYTVKKEIRLFHHQMAGSIIRLKEEPF